MTSKRSFTDLLREDLKRRMWPLALSFIGFFFALPVLALIKLGDHITSLDQGWDTLVSLQYSFVSFALGPSNLFAIAGLMIMAVLGALQGMKYLHSRQEADFYGSIPVLRTSKFIASYINGILTALIPYIIMTFLAAIIGATRGFVTAEGLLFTVQTILLEIAGFLLIYNTIVLASILTGHTAVAVAGGAVISFVLLAYRVLFEGYASTFFVTRYEGFSDAGEYLSPFTVFFKIVETGSIWRADGYMMARHQGYTFTNVKTALISLVISAAILALCYWLIKIRPAEAAGRALAFDKTKPFIKLIIIVPVALTTGLFFPSLTDNSYTYPWLIFGLIAGTLLAHAVIEVIYDFDFKACVKHIPTGIAGGVIAVAIAAVFVFDFAGYDTTLPDRGSVTSAAVYFPGIENSMYDRSYYDPAFEYDGYADTSADYNTKNMVLTDIDDVYTLAGSGCDHASRYRWHVNKPTESDYYDGPAYTQVSVILRKASGKEFRRSYYFDKSAPEVKEAMARIYDTDEYKDNTYDVLSKDDRMTRMPVEIIRYDSAGHSDTASSFTEADVEELVAAMAKETRALSLDYLSGEAPIGYVEFEFMQDKNPDPYVNSEAVRPVGYVYPSFTETIALLNKMGINAHEKISADEVDHIVKIEYDDNGNDLSETINDKEQIAVLIPELINQDYASVNYAVLDADYNSNYEVYLKSTDIRPEYYGDVSIYCVKRK